jgi:hypothetical protein
MIKACALAGLAAVLPGCAMSSASWKGAVEWPTEGDTSVTTLIPATEAGAAIAAAAAIRHLIKTNNDPGLFWGCSSPEQGLDVAVFTGPTPGLYYVAIGQHFDRCGGPIGRVLDWHHVYGVTPQGEVVAEDPIAPGEGPAASPSPPTPPPSEQTPPPAAPSPKTEADTPAPALPPPATGPSMPTPTPSPASPSAPAAPLPAAPPVTSPPPIPPGSL